MYRKLLVVALFAVTFILLFAAFPVFASPSITPAGVSVSGPGAPSALVLPLKSTLAITVYVKTSYTGNEDGSQTQPYNTKPEGDAYAAAQDKGGWVQIINADGSLGLANFVPSTRVSGQGAPLPREVLYVLLAALALVLMLAGWWLRRRSAYMKG